MAMEDEVTSNVGVIIIVIAVLITMFYLINMITDGELVRAIVCGALFWIPFGTSMAKYCRTIPV